ncbi:hypothetical protein UFOVP1296_51 [uncultured Caudovirales phage]|uniref:Uncharacterized protein n=1 Tax=uncultured Caudovirales phage TaxID=2100421 RepID=A0A6J5PHZ2_9CAUD|nr:hypothetical protein UFOVP471_43 [uncultured Caudovirales phage]CAB4169536.1 hypothetical protein UFOVP890_51 [uncultured Caudovirales phage]CAB4196021.1 hypothetical protein UFOVP1296_51 [uncultured Caudovirales phage]
MKYEFKIDLDNNIATARALASEKDSEPNYEAMIEQMLNLAANMLGCDINMDPIEYENNKFTMPFQPHFG